MDITPLAQALISHEYRLLEKVLSNFLGRAPTKEDWCKVSKIRKVYEPFDYILAYDGDALGKVREERTENTIKLVFDWSNVLTEMPEEK